jgi:hypothetical protein
MARSGINKQAIARMMRDIQREFDKHPIRVPLEADAPRVVPLPTTAAGNIYNGPVIYGSADGAQLAWNNQTVDQTQVRTEQVAPGFELLAQAVVSTLLQLSVAGLEEEDQQAAEDAANEVLAQVTRPDPDRGKVKRALSALKGALAPVALGLRSGAGDGAREWAKTAIEQLGTPF